MSEGRLFRVSVKEWQTAGLIAQTGATSASSQVTWSADNRPSNVTDPGFSRLRDEKPHSKAAYSFALGAFELIDRRPVSSSLRKHGTVDLRQQTSDHQEMPR